jgi:hypothetical protein
MPFERTQPNLNVYFINTINTNTGNYGAVLQNEYLSLIDNSNASAFGTVGGGSLYLKQIQPLKGVGNYWTATSSGTAGVITIIEPTLAANTTYGFILNQYIPATNTGLSTALPQNTVTSGNSLYYTTGSTAPAAGTVVTALAALITSNSGFQVTAVVSGTTTLTITANTGYYLIWSNAIGNGAGNFTSITQTITGKLSVGQKYDMYDFNSYGTSWSLFPNYVSTNNYSQFACSYTDLIYGGTAYIYVFVNAGDPNYGTSTTGFLYSFVNNALAMGGVITSSNSQSVLSLLQQANALEYTSL